ncbi:hypothetical protein J4526_04905 [Desulfurococcaceae archaeon MEX13E-LK6-19]|nr:hypothetical protein J4526_04905 [Desulfurococcaceae archaeon MEX13E-LK6-19]
MKRDEEPSLTLKGFVEGTIIVLDLDKFGEMVEEKGLSEYKPNVVTGLLTQLVEEFVRKWSAVVIYGLDHKRGTEEAVIEIPYVEPSEVADDLEKIKREIEKTGASITIVAIKDYVIARSARDRREAYYGTPGRARALKLLKKAKRRGGGQLIIESI